MHHPPLTQGLCYSHPHFRFFFLFSYCVCYFFFSKSIMQWAHSRRVSLPLRQECALDVQRKWYSIRRSCLLTPWKHVFLVYCIIKNCFRCASRCIPSHNSNTFPLCNSHNINAFLLCILTYTSIFWQTNFAIEKTKNKMTRPKPIPLH